jgi:hypothetical protein
MHKSTRYGYSVKKRYFERFFTVRYTTRKTYFPKNYHIQTTTQPPEGYYPEHKKQNQVYVIPSQCRIVEHVSM